MTCDQCDYFQSIETPEHLPIRDRYGECRIKPPRSNKVKGSANDRSRGIFPIIRETDWCGEFCQRAATEPDRRHDEANAALDEAFRQDATGANVPPVDANAGGYPIVRRWLGVGTPRRSKRT